MPLASYFSPSRKARLAIPNILTTLRLVIAVAFFALLALWTYPAVELVVRPAHPVWPYIIAAVLFGLAAITDAIDGPLARRWNAVSTFGRVMDPFADKVLVLGAFIMLAGPNFAFDGTALAYGHKVGLAEQVGVQLRNMIFGAGFTKATAGKPIHDLQVSGIMPWMVVVMLGRELLVTSIRALLEARGQDFSANAWGKVKMIVQACAIPAILLLLALFPVQRGTIARKAIDIIVWSTLIVTIISGVPYVTKGMRMLGERK